MQKKENLFAIAALENNSTMDLSNILKWEESIFAVEISNNIPVFNILDDIQNVGFQDDIPIESENKKISEEYMIKNKKYCNDLFFIVPRILKK